MSIKHKTKDIKVIQNTGDPSNVSGGWTTLHSTSNKKFEVHWRDLGGDVMPGMDRDQRLVFKLVKGVEKEYPDPERLGDGNYLGIKVPARSTRLVAILSCRIDTIASVGEDLTWEFSYDVITGKDCKW